MRWPIIFIFLSGLLSAHTMETQDHAPSVDKTFHFPSASLTIAGDLKDVKLKSGTIAQLLRALQQPSAAKPKDQEPKPKTATKKKIIHPSQLITKHNLNKNGKQLQFGEQALPDTITVSSQSVKVSQANATGGKKSRHLGAFISNNPVVKTVEGVRTPDDEHDKHYTYRNARVIKNFLVPNDRPANPHKKRQIVITDPQQYLVAAAAAHAQGATTIIDTSSMQQRNNNNGQQRSSYYAQEQQMQNEQRSAHSAHPHVAYQNQHQNGQSGFSYAHHNQNQNQQQQQQGPQMYLVQDGNSYKYSNQAQPSTHQAQLGQQQTQAQFFSRSGEAAITSASSSSHSAGQSQHGSVQESPIRHQTQQSLTAAIKQQQQYQPSLDTQAIQAAVEAVQQLEAQQQQQQHQQQHQAAGSHQQLSVDPHQGVQAITQGQKQTLAALLAQQSAPAQAVVLPQGSILTSGGATAQEILAATQAAAQGQVTAQYIQIQQGQEQPILQQLQQQSSQQQYPPADQFSERGQFGGAAFPASSTQFVIQPQTYLAGAGGQTFTVPIPVPVEQAVAQATQQQQQQQQHQSRLQNTYNYQQQQQSVQQHQQHNQQYQHQQQQAYNGNRHSHQQNPLNPNQASITDRMKHAFNQNFNRKMLERVETNAVVPALASTGLFLGLSALAAGWYLSKNNREVGIVRRTGKFSKKKGSPAPPLAPGESVDETTTNTRTRRDLGSMITPQHYTPGVGGAPEVDQATFFQSIIQQSLEKTQKEYDDQGEPIYNQNQDMQHHDQMGYHQQPEPERQGPPPPGPPPSRFRTKNNRPFNDRPSKFFREDDYYEANSRISKNNHQVQEKSGWSVHSAKNFARVAIPAIVLTGAALGICAVIFGWYISGDNREIAFLESPTTNSIGGNLHRRKRSLFGSNWSDGWLIRTLKAIHGNPYDNMPAPTAKSFVPYPYFLEKDSSKTSAMEFKVSNNGLAGVLAGGAVLAVVALGLINSFTDSTGRNLKTGRYNQLLTAKSTNPLTHLRSPRQMENNLDYEKVTTPTFFESILNSLESSGDTIMNKLNELGANSNWQQSSCTKRVLCQVITSQGDDTVRLMEKKMAAVMKMLPSSVSSSINKNYSDVLAAIYKRDCSAFTCSSHSVKKEEVSKSKPKRSSTTTTSSHHHKKSSIKIEQTVSNQR